MEEYFARQHKLWGEDTQKNLENKSIAIVGYGGLGSNLGITLGSSGIGKIYLIDFDTVSIHNIHRQIAFRLDDVGKPKASLLAELIKSRYDKVEVIPIIDAFDEYLEFEDKIDIIIDASDNLPTRAKIEKFARKTNIPWIYTSVEEWHGQVCLFENASFANSIVINDRKPAGIAPPIVSLLAAYEANMTLRYLAGLSVKTDVLNYLFFDNNGQLCIKSLQMPT
ncbi:HesA/MoeB/ThiF family protein [Arcobacter sp. FWKO B]|uniref:HesA/MoeB/ThiF family protein n=1 Tax=Arcobacter sp. FWKO B TaxID=2593672 RepID=UPI0018A5C486|nr:ThiF family adenylyltransferase [Arcobacter sp. FWKO B]QOG11820.1 thiamine biosynthesis protein ThiF [Arcobacter sp. FWKO B]